jgi:hypothetical protein
LRLRWRWVGTRTAAFLRQETARWSKVIANIKPEQDKGPHAR